MKTSNRPRIPAFFVPVVLIMLALCTRAAPGKFVPFVIPAEPNPNSPMAAPAPVPIETDSQRLVTIAGHFHQAGKRLRLLGVNLSFGANFPTHDDAPHIAARLAAAGVNAVRCHHMDTSRWPRGIWNATDGKTLEPEALDRLDYFIDQLARHGIWVNINLHVGRQHSSYLSLPQTNRKYDKISNIFTPALIQAQKRYARQLLGHVNKYRKVRYADDPAVAIVEITNENSFFMWSSEQTLRTLPDYYAKILRGKFNAWLQQQYHSDQELRQAWAKDTQPAGPNLLKNGDFEQRQVGSTVPLHWAIEQHQQCRAWCSRQRLESRRALKIDITRADQTEWHLQLKQEHLAIEKGQYYTVSFEAAADRPRSITCSLSQAHSPWANLGLSQRVELTTKRTTYRYGFVARADEPNARICFAIGGSDIPVHLANVELRPGGRLGLRDTESLQKKNIALFAPTESPARTLDRMRFLAETEKAYFDDMRSFIKNDLGCKALVTGTIIFGPLGLYTQSDMDFIDTHAYWQHPRFPGRPWDPGNWLIDQKAMTDHPEQATLFRLAAARLHGKPFTVSEYNHPAPLDSQAECVPMISSFAAAQDWDGIWLYTYSHSSDDWQRRHLNSYFDIDTNPAKWGFIRSAAAMFRDGCINRLNCYIYSPLVKPGAGLPAIARLHLEYDRDMLATRGLGSDLLNCQIACDLLGRNGHIDVVGPGAKLRWLTDHGKGVYIAEGRRASAYTGHAGMFEKPTGGRVKVNAPAFAALTITSLDAEPSQALSSSTNILVTACGRCQNTGMKFSADRRTVGRDWGGPPVLIEPLEGAIVLPKGNWTCRALEPDGMPARQVPVTYENGEPVLKLSSQYETMWYLLARHDTDRK